VAITITTAAGLDQIDAAPLAVVLLTADYAGSGGFARRVFVRVSEDFPHYFPSIDVQFFLLEEGSPFADAWMGRYTIPIFKPTQEEPWLPLGAGSVLFLQKGKLAQFLLSVRNLASQTVDPNIIVGFLAAREEAGVKALESEIVRFIRLSANGPDPYSMT
jgi:hypothetical protein